MFSEISFEVSQFRIVPNIAVLLFVMLSPVNAANIDAVGSVDCVIYPSQEADVGSGSLGVLESLLVDRAEFVSTGEAVAQLESSAEQAAVALAMARADAAAEVNFRQLSADHSKRQFSRVKKLIAENTVSTKDLDDRRTEAQLGEQQLRKAVENKHILALELERAKVVLAKRTIRSPFDGVVVERYKSAGEYVDADPVMRIVQLHPLHVETIIPAEFVGGIFPGMHAEIVSADDPDKRWIARVDRVDNVVDVASATFGVRLALPNPDFTITAGLRCQLSFINDKASVASAAAALPTKQAPAQSRPGGATKALVSVNSATTPVVPSLAATRVQNVNSRGEISGGADSIGKNGLTNHETVAELDLSKHDSVSVVDTSANSAPQKMHTCVNEGPYMELNAAEARANKLVQLGNDIEVVAKLVSEKKGYLVMSPEFQTRDKADEYVQSLESVGISDSFLPSGITPVRVSIGAFSEHVRATSRVNRLSVEGISAELLPWEKTRQEYYVTARSGKIQAAAECGPSVSIK